MRVRVGFNARGVLVGRGGDAMGEGGECDTCCDFGDEFHLLPAAAGAVPVAKRDCQLR